MFSPRQTWSLLADADANAVELNRDQKAMGSVLKLFAAETKGYSGVLFSNGRGGAVCPVDGIQLENTGSAALALAKHLDGDKRATKADEKELREKLDAMKESLKRLVNETDGAVPAGIQKTGSGYTWFYFNVAHIASAAWAGFFLGATREGGYDVNFNPYRCDLIC